MKNIIKNLVFFVAVMASLNSCEGTLDINESEVDPTVDLVNPDLLLAGAMTTPRGTFEITMNQLGNVYMGHWAGDINNFTGGYDDEFTLTVTQGFQNGIWTGMYQGLRNYQAIINNPSEDYDNHKAIAYMLKSFYFQYLVDVYGNVPYSEALQFGDNLTPAYDDAASIYRGLLSDIDTAIALINSADSDFSVGTEDIVFGGDMAMWKKFGNTIKLKILLRQVNATVGDTQSYLLAEVAALEKDFITTDVTLNPGYEASAGKQNPFFGRYGEDETGVLTTTNNFLAPAEFGVKFMQGQTTPGTGVSTGVVDNRVARLWEPINGSTDPNQVVGIRQGEQNGAPLLSSQGPGRLISSAQDSYLLSAAESYFLQSEAVQRLWYSGDAKALFQSGITASFNELGISGSAAAYITASNGTNLIGWDGSSNKIEAIMTQKWIALAGLNGMEIYMDYKRTGFPVIPLSTVASQSDLPFRLLYPTSEYATNSANVPNQAASEAFSDKIFWDNN